MKTILSLSLPAQIETECLVTVVLDRGEKEKTDVFVSASDKAVLQAASAVVSSGDITAKNFETTWLHAPSGLKAKRLLLVGGGKSKSFSITDLRKLAGAAVRALKPRSLRSLAFLVPEGMSATDGVSAIVEGAFVGNFDPDTYKSDRKDQTVQSLTVVASGDQAALQQAMDQARIVAESQNFTRELVNEPSNRMTPTILANRARDMAKETGLKFEVYGADKIKELKMGAFWGVAQGSDEPPALIVMRYEPAGAPEKPVLGLVGKGITFDTGGISIKPADGMEKMKYD
ncbi:MAG: aminopeptidase, partial [Acidobacteria bacterium]